MNQIPLQIPLIVLCGPTASGKTRLAVDLALNFDGEIVSADSMQVYRSMDIGTAKPTEKERQGVPHHLLDVLDPSETFSVAQYADLAREAIGGIHARGRLPILTGGTGLYLQAVVDNIRYTEMAGDPELREALRREAEREGNEAVWARLREVDPELAEKLHPNNLGRVIRALEVHRLTGIPMSKWQAESRSEPSPYRLLMLGLSYPNRQTLYDRIGHRVEGMLEEGLVEELRSLISRGFSATAAQAIGYKELMGWLEGTQTYEEAVERLKMETRRYAKRQMTWLRRDERIRWLGADREYEEILAEASELVAGFLEGREAL